MARPASRFGGHTLVELLAVMLIVGLLAGGVALRGSALTQRARFEWAISRVEQVDAALRSHARNHAQSTALEFELRTDRITPTYDPQSVRTTAGSLGSHIVVRRFLNASRDATAGRAAVTYSSQGTSPTYAVELVGSGTGRPPVWLVFVGATGWVERLQEERDANQLVRQALAAGTDAR